MFEKTRSFGRAALALLVSSVAGEALGTNASLGAAIAHRLKLRQRLDSFSHSLMWLAMTLGLNELLGLEGFYTATCVGPDGTVKWTAKWYPNTVTTAGKNDLLDKYLSGSSYTAAFYLGLISSTSYSAINAADTMASHAGWLEAGNANTPAYSQGARPTAAWSSASAGAKALSSALAFSITSAGTIKGAFLTTVATKDGTTGVLFSAGLFTGGDKTVASADTVNVSYSLSV